MLVTAGFINSRSALVKITVEIHRGHVMRKMKPRSLADLMRMAEALGLGLQNSTKTNLSIIF
jgi:FixJ family two-component response regulator